MMNELLVEDIMDELFFDQETAENIVDFLERKGLLDYDLMKEIYMEEEE